MMKKLYKIFLLLALTVTSAAYADNRFYVKPTALEPGTTGTLEILLDNSQPIYGFQAGLKLTGDLEPIVKPDGKLDITFDTRRADDSYQIISNQKNGEILMAAFSASHRPFGGESGGCVVKIGVTVAPGYSGGLAALSGIKLVDEDDRDITLSRSETPLGVLPTAIALNVETLTLLNGDIVPLEVTFTPDYTTVRDLTWTSADPSVVTVSPDGVITAVNRGTTEITATTVNGKTASVTVTVLIPTEGITLEPSEIIMEKGSTELLTALLFPPDNTDELQWSSSNVTIATIEGGETFGSGVRGMLTAIGPGEAIITAKCGDYEATCKVTVIVTPTEIVLDRNTAEITCRDILTLIATVLPDDATDKTVTWTSSDESVATVDASGRVTPLTPGTTVITASCGPASATCTVTVVPIPVTGITITNTSMLMRVGYTTELAALVRPVDATDPSVVWSCDNESIVTVDSEGVVTALAVGEAIVTVTSVSNPEVMARCMITVETENVIIGVNSIAISDDAIEIYEGDTYRLTATIIPEDATDRTITWRSADPTVATVSADGVVTGITAGTVTVYASSSNGLTADCFVTVIARTVEPTGISLSNTSMLMRVGYTAELIPVIEPDNATDKTVTWHSADESIATVDANGIVTALKVGVVRIIATTVNGLTAYCEVTVEEEIFAVAEITLNKTELTLTEGETFNLIATITPENATDKTVTWRTSDPTVATVSATGVVTAIKAGTASIYASSSNGLTAECVVTVVPVEPVAVIGISLSNTEMVMRKGHTAELLAIIRPVDAADQSVIWSTDDGSIATVDQNGNVTAVEVGVTRIVATTSNGLTAICTVTVVDDIKAVDGITLNKTELTLTEGETFNLIATITPANAADKSVTWRSSDRATATVSTEGLVTAVTPGVTTIYASSSNGLTAECVVTVVPRGPIPVTGITLSQSELLMRVSYTTDLFAIVLPVDATDPSVTWSSDDESIVTVDQTGRVSAFAVGVTIVRATTSNGLTAICVVTVVPEIIAVTDITLDPTELTLIEGETFTLTATITPDNATDKTVTWLSSNSSVATVSDAGVVTATGAGTAIIYASSSNGLTATCDVTVLPLTIEVITISLDPTELVLSEGETAGLTATITPEDATDQTVTWLSNNTDIATVEDGVVTGVKAGFATITAKSANGKAAYCAVTVNERPLTPRQLLRKGDGTTCTFIVMMGLPDSELTERGYRFAYGYTDRNGQSRIIGQTPLRYCHTTPEIFNDETLDFWAYSMFETADGKTLNSNLRHLDGREEVCFDASVFGSGTQTSRADDDWIKVTPTALYITPSESGEMHVDIYGMTGVPVFSKSYSSEASTTHEIELSRFAVGSYVVSASCGNRIQSKKIIVR